MSREDYLPLIKQVFDQSAQIKIDAIGVPDHWLDYTSDSEAQRLIGLRLEMRTLERYLAHVAQGLVEVSIDAFLVTTEQRGLCRVIITQEGGQNFVVYSRCPTAHSNGTRRPPYALIETHAPLAFSWIYRNLMDGLVDPYGFTGFLPSDRLISMAEGEGYMDYEWFDEFAEKRDISAVVEVFSSGGGAYMLLDLNDNLRDVPEPTAIRISSSQAGWTPESPVLFWPILDAWMAIGLTGK